MNQDLADGDGRWPRFAPEALEAGFHSVHALPMRLRGTDHRRPQPVPHRDRARCGEADVDAAQALADVATIAILQHRAAREAQVLNEQLNQALNTRIVIEQAKGMVAERDGLDMEEAFATPARPRPQPQPPAGRRRPRPHRRHAHLDGRRGSASGGSVLALTRQVVTRFDVGPQSSVQ